MSLFIALLHYPVTDRNSQIVTSSVTNLDLHDIARSCCTFGAERYFVVHPSQDEQALNLRIVSHWKTGYGMRSHPTRAVALEKLELLSNFEQATARVEEISGKKPILVGTSARKTGEKVMSITEARTKIAQEPVLLVFGTGYGLSSEWNSRLDYFLPPISGPGTYNHLSVRSAVAIYLDRLLGPGM